MVRRGHYLWLLALFAAATTWAVAEPTPEELKQQRSRFEGLRSRPEVLARLRHDSLAFLSLPAERREQIIKLDHDLHEESSKVQTKLWNVVDRYADWLDRLPEKDRQAIKQAADASTRLALIRDLRDREWMSVQPKAIRDEWDKLKGEPRGDFIKKLRLEDRQRRQQWQFASRFWRELEGKQALPMKLEDFSAAVQKYVKEYLSVMISKEEKTRLAAAEGKWPDYPQTLVGIAAKHPSALPWATLPTHVGQLPAPVQARVTDKGKGGLAKPKLVKGLAQFDGQPGFAGKVVELGIGAKGQPFEFEFWASSYKALQKPMQEFVEKKLKPVLDQVDGAKLSKVEGSWPHYPLTIKELAEKHNLQPPWLILPEPDKWKWDLYRKPKSTVEGFPEVPKINLREFALFELDADERDKLKLSPHDPKSMSRLVEAYYQRNPAELKRLEMVDRRKRRDPLQTLTVPTKSKSKEGT